MQFFLLIEKVSRATSDALAALKKLCEGNKAKCKKRVKQNHHLTQ